MRSPVYSFYTFIFWLVSSFVHYPSLVDILESLSDGLLGGDLGGVRSSLVTVVEVGNELPRLGNVQELLDGILDGGKGVDVLQVGAETLELQRRPDEDVVDALGMLAPLLEHVSGGGVRSLGLLNGGGILPEDDLRKKKIVLVQKESGRTEEVVSHIPSHKHPCGSAEFRSSCPRLQKKSGWARPA